MSKKSYYDGPYGETPAAAFDDEEEGFAISTEAHAFYSKRANDDEQQEIIAYGEAMEAMVETALASQKELSEDQALAKDNARLARQVSNYVEGATKQANRLAEAEALLARAESLISADNGDFSGWLRDYEAYRGQ